MKLLYRIYIVIALLCISGCTNLGYYRQSIWGHLEVIGKSRPIADWLAEENLNEDTRKHLETVLQARKFASDELDLPKNNSYTRYADLGRPYVVWSVYAAPELSLRPLEWCFPFTGCLAYRGYFHEQDAKDFAAPLRSQGKEVYIAGISAYSTLGWFNDPVLSTMMQWQEYDLVGIVFHELTHQKIYVKDDTVFNESLARMVEREGLRRWFQQRQQTQLYADYLRDKKRHQQFIDLVLGTRDLLEKTYAANKGDQWKRARKAEIIQQLRQEYQTLRESWGGYGGYDQWMASDLNNAKINSVATYYDWVPAFENLLARSGGSMTVFFHKVEELAGLPREERDRKLRSLLPHQINNAVIHSQLP